MWIVFNSEILMRKYTCSSLPVCWNANLPAFCSLDFTLLFPECISLSSFLVYCFPDCCFYALSFFCIFYTSILPFHLLSTHPSFWCLNTVPLSPLLLSPSKFLPYSLAVVFLPPPRQCWIFTWTLVGVCTQTDWWWVRSRGVLAVCPVSPCCRLPIGPSLPVTWQLICLWVTWP